MIREKYLLDLELYHNVYKGIVIKMEKQTKKIMENENIKDK